ncbi:hypothetical protein HanXRQr2_Chr05g0227721 [Helianthus annuus]|uniref:Uncharacterized protein n=1 Tax=Helianthus annuus TaxID=4232 RepID=A0A9K3J173_HELAN|nr:hypothetical protein HanXRQr2_Chr05g0227721 [Helianthus annuus]KAJ0923753.1 hypothetical protein HanPSC8_Chr05g0219751 [Helianthus annuus]
MRHNFVSICDTFFSVGKFGSKMATFLVVYRLASAKCKNKPQAKEFGKFLNP